MITSQECLFAECNVQPAYGPFCKITWEVPYCDGCKRHAAELWAVQGWLFCIKCFPLWIVGGDIPPFLPRYPQRAT